MYMHYGVAISYDCTHGQYCTRRELCLAWSLSVDEYKMNNLNNALYCTDYSVTYKMARGRLL